MTRNLARCIWRILPLCFAVATSALSVAQEALWTKRFENKGYDDYAQGVVIDAQGNVYVAGSSTAPNWAGGQQLLPTSIFIVKYSTHGTRLWVREISDTAYRYFSGIQLDSQDNVVVVGDGDFVYWDEEAYEHFYNEGILIAKFDTDGNRLWTRKYNDPDSRSEEEPGSIGFDGAGNIYVSGASFTYDNWVAECKTTLLKYGPDGTRRWVRKTLGSTDRRSRPKVSVDATGNAFVSARCWTGGGELVTLKYNPNGFLLWERRVANPIRNDDDGGNAVAVDKDGNLVVAAPSGVTHSPSHLRILKYQPNGTLTWSRDFQRAGQSDVYFKIALDSSDNILIGGWSIPTGSRSDYLALKYNKAGLLQWARRYDGPSTSSDRISAIAVDQAGSVYLTGESGGPYYGDWYTSDIATVKWDANGTRQWVRRYDGDRYFHLYDWGSAIAAAPDGSVVIAGSSYLSSIDSADSDYITIKYGPGT